MEFCIIFQTNMPSFEYMNNKLLEEYKCLQYFKNNHVTTIKDIISDKNAKDKFLYYPTSVGFNGSTLDSLLHIPHYLDLCKLSINSLNSPQLTSKFDELAMYIKNMKYDDKTHEILCFEQKEEYFHGFHLTFYFINNSYLYFFTTKKMYLTVEVLRNISIK